MIYTRNISEILPFFETARKNLHTLVFRESVGFSNNVRSQHKFLSIHDIITLRERPVKNATVAKSISQSLIFSQVPYPRATNAPVADLMTFHEFANEKVLLDKIIFNQAAVKTLIKPAIDPLTLVELLGIKRNQNLIYGDILLLNEHLAGLLIKLNGNYVPIIAIAAITITSHLMREIPAGTINGVNLIFALSNFPSQVNSLQIYKNGVLQNIGSSNDYTYNAITKTITFTSAAVPLVGDTLFAYYWQ